VTHAEHSAEGLDVIEENAIRRNQAMVANILGFDENDPKLPRLVPNTPSPEIRFLPNCGGTPDLMLLGPSDAAAICGLSPYQTALDVYARVVEKYRAPVLPQMRRGHRFQGVVLAWMREELAAAGRCGSVEKWHENVLIEDRTRMWLRANMDACDDRVLRQDGPGVVLEAKTHRSADGYGPAWSAEVPEHEMLQVQLYLHLSKAGVAFLGALFGLDDLRVFEIPPDSDVGNLALEALERFHRDHIRARKPPHPGGPAILPKPKGKVAGRKASPWELELARRLKSLRAEAKRLSAEAKEAEEKLRRGVHEHGPVIDEEAGLRISLAACRGRPKWEQIARCVATPERLEQLAEGLRGENYYRMSLRWKGEKEEVEDER